MEEYRLYYVYKGKELSQIVMTDDVNASINFLEHRIKGARVYKTENLTVLKQTKNKQMKKMLD